MASTILITPKLEKPSELIDDRQQPDPELQALKAKLIAVLEKSEQDDKLRTSRKNAASKSVTVIHITSPLFSTLRSCLQQLNYLACTHILKYLVRNMQCSMDLVLQLMTAILEKDLSQPTHLGDFLATCSNLHNVSRDEVRLLHVIHFLNCGQFQDAISVASKVDDYQWSRFKRNTLAPEVAFNLLSGYKMLLQYMESKSAGPDAEGCYLESFQALTTENCFLPLFAETYTKLLLDSSEPEQAEEFIRKFVETESKNSGLLAPLQALSIVKLHMSGNQKLTFDLLQSIAEKDPSHSLVLELCWKYLRNNIPRRDKNQRNSDSDMESEEESGATSKSIPENLKKCLNLIFTFLDSNFNNCQAWSILSENLRNICLSGAKECAVALVNFWYQSGRRTWWLNDCFCLESLEYQQATPVELLANKAISCYILENASHPFIQHILSTSKSNQLKIILNQLEKPKARLDKLVQSILIRTKHPVNHPAIQEKPSVSKNEVRIRKLFLKYLQTAANKSGTSSTDIWNNLTFKQPARELHGVPTKKYDENFFWDLPVYERFRSRIVKREEDKKAKKAQEQRQAAKRGKLKKKQWLKSRAPSSSSSETFEDSEDEIIDQLIHGRKELPSDAKDDTGVFLRPSTPIVQSPEVNSPLPPPSFPCPTPDLQFASTPAPKETIRIEDRYQFFNLDSSNSEDDISDVNATDCYTEPLVSVKVDIKDKSSQDQSANKCAPLSSICTSLSLRLEASSPDIFQCEDDNRSEQHTANLVHSIPTNPQPPQGNGSSFVPDGEQEQHMMKKKRKTKRNKKLARKSLNDICLEVLDKALHNQPASPKAKDGRADKASRGLSTVKSQDNQEDRETLIAELLGTERLTKSVPIRKPKRKRTKRKEKQTCREEIIAELVAMTSKSFQCDLSESVASTRLSCPKTTAAQEKKHGTEAGVTKEREVIIAELLDSNRRSLRSSACPPKRRKLSAEEYIPTDAEELKIQMAIHRIISKEESSSSVESGDLNGRNNALPPDGRRNLNDRLPDKLDSNHRIETWLDQVLIHNAEEEREKSSKRPRAISSSANRKKLFSQVTNFLDTSYRSIRSKKN